MTASTRPIVPLVVLLLAALSWVPGHSAHAKQNNRISKAFRGAIIISDQALPAPDAEDEAGTIKAYKALQKKVITSAVREGVATWNFNFTAFVKTKPKTSSLSLEFYTDDKEKLFVADKRLEGADPNLSILASEVTITEDENVNRGRRYLLKLVARQGNKTVTLATTKISTK